MSLSIGRTNDSEDGLSMDSPTTTDGVSNGGNSNGGGIVLKKGPWTSAEDAILVEYVKKNGEGNWNALQMYSGLSRCGKSCRLRWTNHLRPNLRKGAFTPEEERLIIELHAKLGNKWARMAAHLPGRTDNEIKNYWNTRIKRHQRSGLPLYPPELCLQAFQENQRNQNGELHIRDKGHNPPLQANRYDIPNVMFGNLSTNEGFSPYIPPLPDFSPGGLLMKYLGSPKLYTFIPPTHACRKRCRESDETLSEFGGVGNEGPQFDGDQDDHCRWKSAKSFNMCRLPFGADQGHQFSLTNKYSSSKPISGAVKLELPSFQYPETTSGSWTSNPFLPSLDSVDSFFQSPPLGPTQSHCPSPRSSGLLESLVYEAKALSSSKNPSWEKSLYSSEGSPRDVTECTPLTGCSKEYESYGNPSSPFGNSPSSIFSDCSPFSAAGSSLEEIPYSGSNVKSEPIDHTWYLEGENKESLSQLKFLRPDPTLGSCWPARGASCARGEDLATDAIAAP